MCRIQSASLMMMLLLGGTLASAVAEAQPIPMPNPRTAVAYAACQREADAAVPVMRTTKDQNEPLSSFWCLHGETWLSPAHLPQQETLTPLANGSQLHSALRATP